MNTCIPRVSVIVPIYNAEKSLSRCVDSILRQVYRDFELLLIDDGSTDDSARICDDYAIADSRVRVFHVLNGGVSSARNTGIENAKGEYISFIDSDDFIRDDFLSVFLKSLDSDIVIGGYTSLKTAKIYRPRCRRIALENPIETDILVNLEFNQLYCRTPWTKIFKSSIIKDNKLRFDSAYYYGEDFLFVLEYLLHCSIVEFVDYVGYMYDEPNYSVKYELSNDYIESLLVRIDTLFDRIEEVRGVVIDRKYQYKIKLRRAELSKMGTNEGLSAYYSLYKRFFPDAVAKEFMEDRLCSPNYNLLNALIQNSFDAKKWNYYANSLRFLFKESEFKYFIPRGNMKERVIMWLVKINWDCVLRVSYNIRKSIKDRF